MWWGGWWARKEFWRSVLWRCRWMGVVRRRGYWIVDEMEVDILLSSTFIPPTAWIGTHSMNWQQSARVRVLSRVSV